MLITPTGINLADQHDKQRLPAFRIVGPCEARAEIDWSSRPTSQIRRIRISLGGVRDCTPRPRIDGGRQRD